MIASTQTQQPFAGNAKADPASVLQFVQAKLKSGDLRNTRPRRAILEALSNRTHPASVEQIHREIGVDHCDLVTVYRTMAMFEEIGLVRRSFLHNGTTTFELNLGEPTRYRVTCKFTNEVVELDDEISAELRKAIATVESILRAKGYKEVGHVLEFFGSSPRAGATAPAPAAQ